MALRLIWAGAGLFCLFLAALGVLLPFGRPPPFAVPCGPVPYRSLARAPSTPASLALLSTAFPPLGSQRRRPSALLLRTAFALSLDALLEAMHAVSQSLRRWVRRRR